MFARLTDVTGNIWESSDVTPDELLEELGSKEEVLKQVENILKLLGDLRHANSFSLVVEGRTIYFNPENIVSVELFGFEEAIDSIPD
jgi:hypothetical protein